MTRRSVHIAHQLEKDILAMELPPGELINEVALAERFGVSRTPVREALLSLSSAGLVRLEPGRGAIVVGVSLEQVFESYEVLSSLSGLAAQLCAERMSALERARLSALHDEMTGVLARDDDRTVYGPLNARFHEMLVKGSANGVLANQIAMCTRTILAVRHVALEAHVSLEAAHEEHEQVVQAILARDGEAARRTMSAHVHLRGDGASRLVAAWREHTQGTEASA